MAEASTPIPAPSQPLEENSGAPSAISPIPRASFSVTLHEAGIPKQGERRPLVIVTVGLPARGKSYISRRVAQYIRWLGFSVQIFNVGARRRSHYSDCKESSFFDPSDPESSELRNKIAQETLEELIQWLRDGGQVAIFDATNTTKDRRRFILESLMSEGIHRHRVIFLESVCNDPKIIEANVRETKTTSPDYRGVSADIAVDDFMKRIAHYESAYETIKDEEEDQLSYMKLIDVGKQIIMHQIHGFLPGRIVNLLMQVHLSQRKIFITRHGESEFNVLGKIGGDSNLTCRGLEYARSLADFINQQIPRGQPLVVWTSTLQRSLQTAQFLDRPVVAWKALDEIESGVCDGMTYKEIEAKMPAEFKARSADKLRYRYPRGESYEDLIIRLESVIIELERQKHPVLIITHQAVSRALIAYLLEKQTSECPTLPVELHTVVELLPKAYGVIEKRIPLAPFTPGSGADPK